VYPRGEAYLTSMGQALHIVVLEGEALLGGIGSGVALGELLPKGVAATATCAVWRDEMGLAGRNSV
jgi:4-hydroxy-3-methylbut-2-en-1-yl diphosphate synthase IspG/GcpE